MVFCLQWEKASSLIRFLRAGSILARYEYCGTAVRLLAALSLIPLRFTYWIVLLNFPYGVSWWGEGMRVEWIRVQS